MGQQVERASARERAGSSSVPPRPDRDDPSRRTRRRSQRIVALMALLVLVLSGVYALVGSGGKALSYLDQLPVVGPSLAAKFESAGVSLDEVVLRVVIVALGLLGLTGALVTWRSNLFTDFFRAETHPFNLAVWRIVAFGLLLTSPYISQALVLSDLPAILVVPPAGLGALSNAVSNSPPGMLPATVIFLTASALAMVGLYFRVSAVVAVVAGFYVLGVPQFFGKVSHYHHVLWFPALLAASPCADTLSIDAARRVLRAGGSQLTRPLRAARRYALPLRFTWLLMGLVYFFPGLWKFVRSGTDWILGDNLALLMYGRWVAVEYTPFFRIDQYPILIQLAAAGAVLFELTFILLILAPGARMAAAGVGLLFHNANRVFMRLPFTTMQWAYVTFVDWHKLGAWIAARFDRLQLDILAADDCGHCQRVHAVVSHFDLFNQVNEDTAGRGGPLGPHAFQVRTGEDVYSGGDALRKLLLRVPVAAVLLPAALAPSFRRSLDVHDTLDLDDEPSRTDSPTTDGPGTRAIALVGTTIFVLALLAGLATLDTGWPFASYPQFARLADDRATTITVEVDESDGGRTVLAPEIVRQRLNGARYDGLVQTILNEPQPERQREQLIAFLALWESVGAELAVGDRVRFVQEDLSVRPEEWAQNPLRSVTLYEYEVE